MTDELLQQARNGEKLPSTWTTSLFHKFFTTISTTNKKVKAREYLKNGCYPVIDQGANYIGGYTNDRSKIITVDSPVIVFGDHSRVFKYVTRDFAPGADGIKIFAPIEEILNAKYAYYACHSINLPNRGYARHYTYLKKSILPLAPLAEQTRIADKIDSLFSQLDAGEEALRTAELLLERYRQSVLKAAVTGELTHAWREKNRGKLESGEELLERILKARRENWEGRGKYKEPARPDTTDLPELPEGWVWASLGQLFTLHNGDRGKNYPSRKDYVPNGIPIINAGHLENGKIDLARLNYIKEEHYSRLRAGKIQPNDILVCIRGSLGKFALSNLSEGAIASSLVILRSSVVTTIEYVMLYLASPLLKDEIFKYDNGTAQPNLSAENLGRFAIPLPPIHEMYALIEMMSGFSANVESLVDVLNKTSLRSSSLRQSILREAFSGRLVPQDPADEPAWVLLERIGKGKG